MAATSYSIESDTGLYPRDHGATRDAVARQIATLYGAEQTELVTSGTQAIYMVLDCLALHFKRGVFLISTDLYSGTANPLRALRARHSEIQFKSIDLFQTAPSLLADELSKCQVLYMETCSNPNGYILDPTLYSHLQNVYVVMDNTWLSPAGYNPFTVPSVRIVVESGAKYLSGGQCIVGSATFRESADPIAIKLREQIRLIGVHVSTPYCQLLQASLTTLSDRVAAASERVPTVLDFLQHHAAVDIVLHPRLHSPELAARFTAGPNVIHFHVQCVTGSRRDRRDVTAFRDMVGQKCSRSNMRYITSFGHAEDTIDSYPKVDATGIWLRLAIGYFPTDDWLIKLERLLTELSS